MFLLIMKHMLIIKSRKGLFQAPSPKKTCRSFSATNFMDYCFFNDDGNETGLSCRSRNLDKHVSEWLEYLRDSKLLAKLSKVT